MRERNDGLGEDNILHNQFTAYLMKSLRNAKIQYIRQKIKLQNHETGLESLSAFIDTLVHEDSHTELSVFDQLENYQLQKALRLAHARDLYILYARVLYDQSFLEIALVLGLKLKTVASIYYRLIERLRDELRGDSE
jgi:RNA polymerase sigma factor (sigma-70 family)